MNISKEKKLTRRATTPVASAASSTHPSAWIPSPKRMSNSATSNGAATLFFTTFTRARTPMGSARPASMIFSLARMSRRHDA